MLIPKIIRHHGTWCILKTNKRWILQNFLYIREKHSNSINVNVCLLFLCTVFNLSLMTPGILVLS